MAIGKIGSGLTLVAFVVAAVAMLLRHRLLSRERQLLIAPESERASLIQSLNDSFLITALPIDPAGLTRDQRYELLLKQVRDRARRFYVTTLIVILIATAIASMSIVAISRAIPPAEQTVDRSFEFPGPYRIARKDSSMTFDLTGAIKDATLANKSVRIMRATFSADVSKESHEAFGFDHELLAFTEPPSAQPPIIDSMDLGQYYELSGYTNTRRVYQFAGRTDWGRANQSKAPLRWVINVPEGSAPGGDLKKIRDVPISVGADGLMLQVFLWSAWGGDHFVELKNVHVQLRLSVAPK